MQLSLVPEDYIAQIQIIACGELLARLVCDREHLRELHKLKQLNLR